MFAPTRILVTCGPKVVEICNQSTVRRYLTAPNAEIVRSRKGGFIVRVNLAEESAPVPRQRGMDREQEVVSLVHAAEYGTHSADQRPSSTMGMHFEQELSTGRVFALRGVIGSESEAQTRAAAIR